MFSAIRSFFSLMRRVIGNSKTRAVTVRGFDLVSRALPIVEEIARMTPGRRDDAIIRLVRSWLPDMSLPRDRKLTDQEKALYLRALAVEKLRRLVGDWGIPKSVIDLAVQLAYTIWRAKNREAEVA